MTDAAKKAPDTTQIEPQLATYGPLTTPQVAAQRMAATLNAVRERMVAEIDTMRARNQHAEGDGEAVRLAKAAALAMCDMLRFSAEQGTGGVTYQRDTAYSLGVIFGAVVRARRLSKPGALGSVEDLAADFGMGAARAALERR